MGNDHLFLGCSLVRRGRDPSARCSRNASGFLKTPGVFKVYIGIVVANREWIW
jgi:hypothetical protein